MGNRGVDGTMAKPGSQSSPRNFFNVVRFFKSQPAVPFVPTFDETAPLLSLSLSLTNLGKMA